MIIESNMESQGEAMSSTLDLNKYLNELDKITLTYSEVEIQLEGIHLEFSDIKDPFVEYRLQIPMFVSAFYDFIFDYNKVPTQLEFWEHYQLYNKDFFDDRKFQPSTLEALKARAYRTYPSLIRDVHFNLLLKSRWPGNTVLYNRSLDIEEGIDILIKGNTDFYAVNLFTDTNLAKAAREKKANRHDSYSNLKYIDMPVNFRTSHKKGDFFLYGDVEYEQLKNKLISVYARGSA